MNQLAERIIEKLMEKHYKISFAETLTGGGIAKEIIKIPGASRVIDFSLICYSNESKNNYLNVSEDTLKKYGAVSEETVMEMVTGLIKMSFSDVGLAVSGIAGPNGATNAKPIGMVCVAMKLPNIIIKDTWLIDGKERETIIEKTIEKSLFFIEKNLEQL